MYVIFLMILGLLSPLPFVTPFSYDFMSDNDMENVRYGPTDMQRGFDHGIKNSIVCTNCKFYASDFYRY